MNYPGFIGPTYVSQSPIADCERCINWYPEIIEASSGKNKQALYPTPGRELLGSAPVVGVGRALFVQNDRAFAVIGDKFVEIFPTGLFSVLGTLPNMLGEAYIRGSGTVSDQVAVCSGGQLFVFNTSTNVFSGPVAGLVCDMLEYLDGFFIALNRADSAIRISNSGDALTWDVLQFRVRNRAGDKWQAVHVVHGEIWLIGSQSYEVWNNTGTSPFPFNPIPGVFFQEGTRYPESVVHVGESILWLTASEDGIGKVVVSNQYAPQRISNHSLEYAVQQFALNGGSLNSAKGLVYQENGHDFYILRIDGMETSWVLDVTTMQWHERAEWDGVQFTPWAITDIGQSFGRLLALHYQNSNVYYVGTGLDDGSVIRRVRRAPHVHNEKKNVRYAQFELDMQTGIGLQSGQGSNPEVMLRFSDDGGMTYGSEIKCSAGAAGKYSQRVWWHRLGAGRDRVFEVSVSDPVPWRLVNAYLELAPWNH